MPTSFSAGSEVLWTPVLVKSDGSIRLASLDSRPPEASSETRKCGWLASRQPPRASRPCRQDTRTKASNPLVIDVTPLFLSPQLEPTGILFDARFTLTLLLHLSPTDTFKMVVSLVELGARVFVVPFGRYFLPQIILRRTHEHPHLPDIVLWQMGTGGTSMMQVNTAFVRVLDAI